MPTSRLLSRCRWIAGCITLLLAAGAVASAETGTIQTFPLPRVRARSGLTVDVDTRGVTSNGYRRVRVKVSNTPSRNKPPVPVTADRRFRIVLDPEGVGHVSRVKTSKVIEIPEKQSSAEAVIPVPTAGDWYQLSVSVYEGGEHLADVSGTMSPGFMGVRTDSELLPTLLFVDYDVPDRATRDNQMTLLATRPGAVTDTFKVPDFTNLLVNIPYTNLGMAGTPLIAAANPGTRLSDAQVLALASQHCKVQLSPPAELPEEWVELSCFDIALISLDDLARMAKDHPRQRRALANWLHSGPTLVVYGVGDELSRLREVEQLLELPPLPKKGGSAEALRGWSPATPDNSGRTTYQNPQQVMYGNRVAQMATPASLPAGTAATPDLFQYPGLPFASRPAGLGWVVAVAHLDPFPASTNDWRWLLNSIPEKHQIWSTRHGMSYQSYNRGLWDWYIPGVGAAPVFSFVLLATLFAIVIGPVNYLLLGRINRLYLLLVTVPVGAAVVTIGLFSYAVLSDGLGVQARIRSFTLLDQQSGRAVSWSRQSYYASLVPSQGPLFPNDAVVWPLDERPFSDRQGPSRQLNWEAQGQRLRSGYLSSRRLTQFMVTRSARSKSKLTIVSQGKSPPRVTNELGSTVEHLFVCDRGGNYFRAEESLAAGAQQNLVANNLDGQPLKIADVQTLLRRIYNDHNRGFPDGYDPVAEERRTQSPWNRMYWNSSPRAVQDTGILESNLKQLGVSAEIPGPGMYVAVVEKNPDVPLGVEDAAEAESFHVILGRW